MYEIGSIRFENEFSPPTPAAAAAPILQVAPRADSRLRSLDALRGFDMFWIVGGSEVVRSFQGVSDNGATRFLSGELEHADWYGLHFYDLIFPLFMFLVGVGIHFSLHRVLSEGRLGDAVRRIVRRGLLIYFVGVFFNGGLALGWAHVRWIGVLQQIGVCYTIAALIYCAIHRRPRTIAAVAVCMLAAHWALLKFVPFPDLTVTPEGIAPIARRIGSTDPAAIAAAVPGRVSGVFDHGHNLANYVDFRFLPGKKPEPLFAWEGMLSPLSASTLCLLGALAGILLKNGRIGPRDKARWLILGGIGLVAAGALWGFEMPVVKKLWSSSFCLIGSGYGALLLGLFYQIIDIWKFDRWCTPFVWIGANPISIYLLSGFVGFKPLARRLFGAEVQTFLDHVLHGLGDVAIETAALVMILLVARFLFQRKIFLRL